MPLAGPSGASQPTQPAGTGPALSNPAIAARVRQLAAQAGHRRAIAEFRASRSVSCPAATSRR